MSVAPVNVPVAIIGGGPVGLAAAIGLRHWGVDCIVLEQHDSTLDFPKGRAVNARTMEIFSQWGVAADVLEVGWPAGETMFGYLGETLLSEDFRILARPQPSTSGVSPWADVVCSQERLEPVLSAAAVRSGADVRFGHRVVAIDQHADGVQLTVMRSTDGATFEIGAAYAIAADGSRSPTREQLAISMLGPGAMGDSVSILVDAPIGERMADRAAVLYGVAHPRPGAGFAVVDNDRRWLLMMPRDVASEPPESFTEQRCVELVRPAIGDDSVPVTYLGHRLWQPTARWAETMASGRVYLAGDAAHSTSPAGGLGMTGGIADAHNLVWKLAAVLHGWADPDLLETYDVERRPQAKRAAEASVSIAASVRDPDSRRGAHGVSLGVRYESSAICADGTDPVAVEDEVHDYRPSGRPGGRAPHVDDGTGGSVLDHYGSGFVVLVDESHPDRVQLDHISTPVPLRTVAMSGNEWRDLYGVSPLGVVVVRPDGFVAFRSSTSSELVRDVVGALQAVARR